MVCQSVRFHGPPRAHPNRTEPFDVRLDGASCAILELWRVLESERGSACATRETRKQRGVVGVRLEPLHLHSRYFLVCLLL